MPHYLVELRERADPKSLTRTRPTLWTHMTPEDMSYVTTGFSFRKSKKIAPGLRLNVCKSGLGLSAGMRGPRV